MDVVGQREMSDAWVVQETLDRLRVQRDQARAQVDHLETLLTEARRMYLRNMNFCRETRSPEEIGLRWRQELMQPVVKAAVVAVKDPGPETLAILANAVRDYEGREQ